MSHYYTIHGQLIDKVPMRTKGREQEFKDTTITEARALGLLPSVTTLLQVMAKPAVEKWKLEHVAKAAVTDPYDGSEEWVSRTARRGDELAGIAADHGTEIHNWVCALLGGRRPMTTQFISSRRIAEYVVQWVKAQGYKVLETERTFVNESLGIAGTIDIKVRRPNGKVVRMDIKTNSFRAAKDCPDYAEHRYQLAGYAMGDATTEPEDEREILYVSRENIGLIVPKVATNPSKDDRAFLSIAHAWGATRDWRFPASFYRLLMSYEEME